VVKRAHYCEVIRREGGEEGFNSPAIMARSMERRKGVEEKGNPSHSGVKKSVCERGGKQGANHQADDLVYEEQERGKKKISVSFFKWARNHSSPYFEQSQGPAQYPLHRYPNSFLGEKRRMVVHLSVKRGMFLKKSFLHGGISIPTKS